MNCTKCNQPLTSEKELEIMDAEIQLSNISLRKVTLPAEFKVCDDCFDLAVGEKEVN